MGNIFNEDFIDFISVINKNEVDYMLVGGYSAIVHGVSRTTGVMDIWVRVTEENYIKLHKAFINFGLSTDDFTRENFLKNSNIDVFTYGRPPVSIDIMKQVKGLEFDDVYGMSFMYDITKSVQVRVIHKNHLILAKKASGRSKDLDDLENLKNH